MMMRIFYEGARSRHRNLIQPRSKCNHHESKGINCITLPGIPVGERRFTTKVQDIYHAVYVTDVQNLLIYILYIYISYIYLRQDLPRNDNDLQGVEGNDA